MRVRDYQTQTTGIITAAGASFAVLLSPFGTTAGAGSPTIITNIVGVYGASTQAGNAGNVIAPAFGVSFPAGKARMHRLGVSIACLGPTALGAVLPTSYVKFGVLKTPMDATAYATWGLLCNSLLSKSELATSTGAQLMYTPRHVASYPQDRIAWESLKRINAGAAVANLTPDDALGTIAILFSTGASADQYALTVHVDWDVMLNDDAGSADLLSSAAIKHPELPTGILDRAVAAAESVAGVFEKGASIVQTGIKVAGVVEQAYSAVPRAARSLALPWA